jgi:hypothetical protein
VYADDVALFLNPSATDISITMDILQLFGEASGLYNQCFQVVRLTTIDRISQTNQ